MRSLAILFLVCTVSMAQERPANVQPNTLYISAQGSANVEPDTAVVRFHLSAQEKSAKAAYDRASRGVEQVREMLRASSIDPASAEFGSFQLRPVYDYRGAKRKATAYQANSNVSLKLKELARVGAVLDQISNIEVAEDISLTYLIENTGAAKKRAVEAAIANARIEAQQVAIGMSRQLGEVIYVSVDTQEHVQAVFAETGGGQMQLFNEARGARQEAFRAPTEEFAAGNVAVTATVYALFGLK